MVKSGIVVTALTSIAVATLAFLMNYDNPSKAIIISIVAFSATFLVFTVLFKNKVSETKEEDVYVYAEIIATKLRSKYNLMVSIEKDSLGIVTKFPKTHALFMAEGGNVVWSFVDDTGKDRNFMYNIHKGTITGTLDYSLGVSPVEKVKGMLELIDAQEARPAQAQTIKNENQNNTEQTTTTKEILQQLMGTQKQEEK